MIIRREYRFASFIFSVALILVCLICGCLIGTHDQRSNSGEITGVPSYGATTHSPQQANQPPKAWFWYGVPNSSRHPPFDNFFAGETLQFNASLSEDPSGTITSYDWNFGDNTTGSGISPGHMYMSTGTFTVNLTVTGSTGRTGSFHHIVIISPTRICC